MEILVNNIGSELVREVRRDRLDDSPRVDSSDFVTFRLAQKGPRTPRRGFGYVIAFSLLVLEALLLPIIAVATALQVSMGIESTPGEMIGPIAGFGVLAIMSLWVMRATLDAVPAESPSTLL